jgi:hypothetical protein
MVHGDEHESGWAQICSIEFCDSQVSKREVRWNCCRGSVKSVQAAGLTDRNNGPPGVPRSIGLNRSDLSSVTHVARSAPPRAVVAAAEYKEVVGAFALGRAVRGKRRGFESPLFRDRAY